MDVGTKDVQGRISLSPYRPGTNLRVSSALAPLPKTNFSLLAISNVFGWAIIVTSSDANLGSGPVFLLTRLDDLQTTIDGAEQFSTPAFNIQEKSQTVVVPTALICCDASVFVTHVAFAAWDRLVIVATSDGSLHVFSLYALVDQKCTVPLRSIHPASRIPLKMLIPNPSKGGPMSGVVALVYQDGTIKVVDCYDTGKTHWTGQLVTAAEWSPMGKRLFVGYSNGRLEFLTHDGITKGKIDPPPLAQEERLSVSHIKWLDQKNYIITFSPTGDQADEMNETYCLHMPKQSEASACTFAKVVDAITSDGDTSLPPELSTVAISVNPQTNWKHIAISSFTNSTSLTLIGYDESDTPFFLKLEEGRPEIPVADDDHSPSAPLGFALSFCTRRKTPLIWRYSTDGVLSLWQLSLVDPSIPEDVKVWSEISDFDDISTVGEKGIEKPPPAPELLNPGDAPVSSQVVQQATAAAQSPGFGSFGSSAATVFGQPYLANSQAFSGTFSSSQGDTRSRHLFGNSERQSSALEQPSAPGKPAPSAPSPFGQPKAFGKLSSSKSPSPFGSATAFGKPASSTSSLSGLPSAFGKLSSSTSPSPFGLAIAFGQTASSAPSSFGQLSVLGKLDTSTSLSPFGSATAFGKPASPASSPFGQPTTFGKSDSTTSPLLFDQASEFGKPASSPSSPFGQPTTFGKSDSTTSPSPLGQPSAFGQPSFTTASPFGQPSAFGELGPLTSSSPFGQASGFGQQTSSTPSPFVEPTAIGKSDSTTSPSPFGQASAFGKPTCSASSLFGQLNAFGTSTAPAPVLVLGQTASTPVSAFGQPPSPTVSAFGQPASPQASAFGHPASSQVAAFGQPSAFAKTASPTQVSAFGQPSAFGKPASPAPVSAFEQSGAFGKPTFPTSPGTFPTTSAFGESPFGATAFEDTASLVRPPVEDATATSSAGFVAFANSSSKPEVSCSGGFAQFANTTNQTSFLSGDTASTSTNVLDNPHSDAAQSAQKPQTTNTNSFSQSSSGPSSSVSTKPEDSSFSKNSTATTANLSNFQPRVTEIHEGNEEEPTPQSAGSGTSSRVSGVAGDMTLSQLSQALHSMIDTTSVPLALHANVLNALSLVKSTSNFRDNCGSVQQATQKPSRPPPPSFVRPVSFGIGGSTQPASSRTSSSESSVPLESTLPTSSPLPQSIPPPPSARPSESMPPPALMTSQVVSTPSCGSSKLPSCFEVDEDYHSKSKEIKAETEVAGSGDIVGQVEKTVEVVAAEVPKGGGPRELDWSSGDEGDSDILHEAKEELKTKIFELGVETTKIVAKLMKMIPKGLKEEAKKAKEELKKEIEKKMKDIEFCIDNEF
ncbi:hypothetical protein Pst134EA_004596 [Puccinia striiformis f. sp. tritici]|uniref:hypothetical protein n=2 Tax=Puccinia striiformis f. sp. tritici TaxID=168172 RepID=UPI0020073F5B|nr:hypothetical protein Pst134EA_004596 [Puccinia striiformis f. sp. tritici]KAH9470670.1 hypothetical protein Pst134EA_004596 [Puccinia striiformis f. sp. tritici]